MSIDLETLVIFAKKRGFVFPSSELYDGFSGVYDYGPLGVELINNIKMDWWKSMVHLRSDIVGLDAGILMNPKVWEASGHTKGFSDPVVVCTKTGKRFRADHLLEEIGIPISEQIALEDLQALFEKHRKNIKIDGCDVEDLSKPQLQNLLVATTFGDSDEKIYLRGETCQGIYVNFKQVLDSTHMKIPFGIAQIGKAFRNEISPRQFIFRTREFEQMEMQYFIHKEDSKKYFKSFTELRLSSLQNLGIKKENLRVTPHESLVFYAKAASDIEYQYPFGWRELEGIHDRSDYDLRQHGTHSGKKITYFDQEKEEHIVPHVIETSVGVGRLFLAVLHNAYEEEELKDGTTRVVLRLKPSLAPMAAAVLPLMKKDGLPEKAKEIHAMLSNRIVAYYDDTGAVGKRYRRADEIGTPVAVTIDYETLKTETVTIRHRDSMEQSRVKIIDLLGHIEKILQE